MNPKRKNTTAPGQFLPEVKLEAAEKVLRDIARRSGEIIRKRRSVTLKSQLGDGYAVIDPRRNFLLSGGQTQDGCDLSLTELAKWYESAERNTPWQRTVIKAILAGRCGV